MSATTGSVSNQARKSTEASPSAVRPLVVRPLVVSPLVVIPLVVRPLVVSPLVVRPLLVSSASGVGPAGGGAEQAASLAAVAASAANHVRSLRLCAIDLSLARREFVTRSWDALEPGPVWIVEGFRAVP